MTIDFRPDEGATEFVIEQLKAFNDSSHPLIAEQRQNPSDPVALQAFAREGDRVVGAVLARAAITWQWLEISIVWVDEEFRGKGIGTLLMNEIEEMGRRHGCTRAKVSSWEFQAPGFYEKRGYVVYGVLDNYPEGVRDFMLWKSLA